MLGTSVESVRLQMLMERVRYRYAQEKSELGMVDLFLRIEQLPDSGVRAACLSWLLYSLQQFPNFQELEQKTSLISQTTQLLLKGIDSLLEGSADHYQAAKDAVNALVRANPELGYDLAKKLNTQDRRDKAM